MLITSNKKSTTSPQKEQAGGVRGTPFPPPAEPSLFISKGLGYSLPASLASEIRGPRRNWDTPSSKGSSWMGRALQTRLLSLGFKFPLPYFLLSFCSIFSSHVSHPVNVILLVGGDLERETSCKVDAGVVLWDGLLLLIFSEVCRYKPTHVSSSEEHRQSHTSQFMGG